MSDRAGADLLKEVRLDPQAAAASQAAMEAAIAEGPKRPKRSANTRGTEPFAHLTIREFLAGAEVLSGALELAVWVYILRERRIRATAGQTEPFSLTNGGLASWGISRAVKGRALRKLARAGLVRVERDGNRCPRISVLVPMQMDTSKNLAA
jgi:DNA-binding transcriptional ArsR family regulator